MFLISSYLDYDTISIFEKYDSASLTFVISTFESGDNDVVENQCKAFLKKPQTNVVELIAE